jgi:hypothetical protein
VDFADVQELERRDLAPGKTTGLIVGLAVLGYTVLWVEAFGSLLNGL